MGSTYKKNNSLSGWAVVVLGGGVRLFGSDEERERELYFYYMWVPHDKSYMEKI